MRLRAFAPYGSRDLLAQIGVWVGFGLAYEAVRGAVGHDRVRAFADARRLIAVERGLHVFFEASLQRGLVVGSTLEHLLAASYWLSEFALLVLALAYAYLRRREVYRSFRNAVLVANGLGLVGYLAFPAAPPRLFPAAGFRNVLSGQPLPVHPTGLIGFAGNPYAAMPSLHIADAILVAVFLGSISSSRAARVCWFLWPGWLAYVVLVTGNHFCVDVVAGAAVAAAALLLPVFFRLLAGFARSQWWAVDAWAVAEDRWNPGLHPPRAQARSSRKGGCHDWGEGAQGFPRAECSQVHGRRGGLDGGFDPLARAVPAPAARAAQGTVSRSLRDPRALGRSRERELRRTVRRSR